MIGKVERDAIQCHNSSVRFLVAGMYNDAISSIIQGLDSLGERIDLLDAAEDYDASSLIESHAYCIDENPLDFSIDVPSTPDLLVTFIYNLALAHHLSALNERNNPKFRDMLIAALKLYNDASQRSGRSDSTIVMPLALNKNRSHVVASLQLR
jgi:hypothetical protein